MLRHDVLTVSYLAPNPNQDAREHSRVTFRPTDDSPDLPPTSGRQDEGLVSWLAAREHLIGRTMGPHDANAAILLQNFGRARWISI